MSEIGVLVMAYGGPATLEDVEPYLRDVRGWRPTPEALVREVRARYARIGGGSPIVARTEAQAAALQAALNAGDGPRYRAIVGMRHWHPYIADALARLAERGIRRAVGLVMAPHYSRLSVGQYYEEVKEADSGVHVAAIESWASLPGYTAALARSVQAGLERFPAGVREGVTVVFTAHSLPERIRASNDAYPEQLAATLRAVLEHMGPQPHRFAYQSAGRSDEPWLGPDVAAVVEELAAEGCRQVLIAPIGFVCEHVEVLYDLDVDLRGKAERLGVRLERTEMLNDNPLMIQALAELVRSEAARAGWT